MPATAIIAGVSGLATAGSGIAQAIGNGNRAKQIRKEIDEYQRQDLVNPYENLQVSTLGADRQREDLSRTMATYGNLMALGGTRAAAAMMPQLVMQQNAQEAQIVANLDEQEKQRQQLIAQGNAAIQQMTEQRERDDLLGMGAQLNVANQQKAQGWNTFAQGVTGLGMSAASGMFNDVFKDQAKADAQFSKILPGAEVSKNSIPQSTGLNNNAVVASSLATMPSPLGLSAFGNLLPFMGFQAPDQQKLYQDFLRSKNFQTA